MCNIGVVVLHYETLNNTIECIDSILSIKNGEQVKIVVVDNGSKKGKLETIENNYKEKKNVIFLYSTENLGYAKGNNLGLNYAKNILRCEIIILANNDLIFSDYKFFPTLMEHYRKDMFDVAGPRIISLMDHKNQNPVQKIYKNLHDVKVRRWKFIALYILSFFNLDTKLMKDDDYAHRDQLDMADFQLHGSCVILGNKYVKNYPGLCDKTFMYGEECILKYIVDRDHLNMYYYDDIIVNHKEASTTKEVLGKGGKKRRFYYKWAANGCNVQIKLMENKISFYG